MAVDATISGESSNSYVTMTEAEAYFAARLHSSAWDSANDTDREKALLQACRQLEACRLRVDRRSWLTYSPTMLSPVEEKQALTFPRFRDTDSSGSYFLPEAVKQAQCEEALALLAFGEEQERRSALQAGGVTGFAVDGLSEQYGGVSSSPLVSARARQLLEPYVERGGVIATSDNPAGEFTPGSS
ncbi:MAG: hypothetical protein JXA87_03895 [Thermoleophilia bacterium]|nr:hypothetical protein [Thermoleophilia bacterium]